MFANRYTALIDACVLVSAPRRDLLLTLAEAEFFRVRWSRSIISETQSALRNIFEERGFEDHDARAARAVRAMQTAFPEALVDDQEAQQPMTLACRTPMMSMSLRLPSRPRRKRLSLTTLLTFRRPFCPQ